MRWTVLTAAIVLVAVGACTSPGPDEPAVTSSSGWQPPPAGAVFDYQLGGAYPPAAGVGIVVRDRTAAADPQRYSICYVNTFQTQPGENDWWAEQHGDLLLKDANGDYVEDPDWPGERLLDTRAAGELADVAGEWFAGCRAKGFRAVEPDNLDSWTRSGGLLTRADALAYSKILIDRAHVAGLAIAQKNTPDVSGEAGFDFAIAEECAVYDECGDYLDAYGRQVYEIEYTDNGVDAYGKACESHGEDISIILRDRDVVPAGTAGYRYENC